MIVDSSAIIAVLLNEPDAAVYAAAIERSTIRRISAATHVELGIVVDTKRHPVATRRLDELLHDAGIQIEPVTEHQARLARAAYRDFGKGSGHPARLNFGDCFAYALAVDKREPLLFKGDDFSHTGIASALG